MFELLLNNGLPWNPGVEFSACAPACCCNNGENCRSSARGGKFYKLKTTLKQLERR